MFKKLAKAKFSSAVQSNYKALMQSLSSAIWYGAYGEKEEYSA